ncbi:MAG: hypothetical protein JRI97_01970 [Deltaproteobacteria bacterium]|nr:hypothetical protein [Deltaproteobacteria bacterium]
MGPDNPFSDDLSGLDLFEDLGPPSAPEPAPVPPPRSGILEVLHQETTLMDIWRASLVDFFCAAGDVAAGDGERGAIARVVRMLDRLDCMVGHGGVVLVRHRGRPPGSGDPREAEEDYTVHLGPLTLDGQDLAAVCARLEDGKNLVPVFSRAARNLADARIHCLRLSTRVADPRVGKAMDTALSALARWLAGESLFSRGEKTAGVADPNLAILAAVNGRKESAVAALALQVQPLLDRSGPRDPLASFPSAYEALFAFDKLKAVLIRPPLEVNNPRWLIRVEEGMPLTPHQARLARLAVRLWGPDSQNTARAIDGLWGPGYAYTRPLEAADRISLASELLAGLEDAPDPTGEQAYFRESLMLDVYTAVESRLSRMPDEMFSGLAAGPSRVGAGKGKKVRWFPADKTLAGLARFFCQRAATKAKIKALMHHKARFSGDDFTAIARDFSITIQDARDLVEHLEGCFDGRGRFARDWFESAIPAFCRHQEKVFGFLWYYLKKHIRRGDRILLLNGLKRIIDRMDDRNGALDVLFEDLVADPRAVDFSHRNALMLMNVLVRTFNQELDEDIEMTPEDVLSVHEGLDAAASAHARALLREERERFFHKVRAVHTRLAAGGPGEPGMEHLILLEREMVIFLALVGGSTARTVLVSAMSEYAGPGAGVYARARDRRTYSLLLTMARVLSRAIARWKDSESLSLLLALEGNNEEFLEAARPHGLEGEVEELFACVRREAARLARN